MIDRNEITVMGRLVKDAEHRMTNSGKAVTRLRLATESSWRKGSEWQTRRDRAMLGVMVYTFARIGAVVALQVENYYESRGRRHLRLHEKGGKVISVALNMRAAEYLHAGLEASGLHSQPKTPLFRAIQHGKLRDVAPQENNIWACVKRYGKAAGLSPALCITASALRGSPCTWRAAELLRRRSTWQGMQSPRRPSFMTVGASSRRQAKSTGSLSEHG